MSSRSRSKLARAGFTILEVLIAMALLAVISFAIYRTTTEAFRLREILMTEGEFHNGVRMAMNLVGRDIELLYSPTMIVPERKAPARPGTGNGAQQPNDPAAAQALAQEQRELEELAATGQDRPSQHWGGMISKLGIRPSRFVGTEDSMTLVSASHIRVYQEAKEGDLARITYEVRPDSSDRENSTRILMKTTNSNAFDMEERLISDDQGFQKTYPLLRGIRSIRFQYYLAEKETWLTQWDTESADLKNRYPDVVRITLNVIGPGRLTFEGTYDFRPEIPIGGLVPSY